MQEGATVTQQEMFGKAAFVGAADCKNTDIFVLRGRFSVRGVKKATLRVLGLGFFHCYINGQRVGNDLFLPLSTDYEERKNYPVDEVISGHRIYVPEYDVTSMLRDGENVVAIHFGGGWYTFQRENRFGDPKAIWRILGEDDDQIIRFM